MLVHSPPKRLMRNHKSFFCWFLNIDNIWLWCIIFLYKGENYMFNSLVWWRKK